MTIESILGTEKSVNNILAARQSNSDTDFADILSKRADLQSEIQNTSRALQRKMSDNLHVSRGRVIEQRPCCIICGLTISDQGTCLCEYPTVINNCGISLKHNSKADGAAAQTKAAAVKDMKVSANDAPRSVKEIKLRHKCPFCGAVTDNGNCGCGNLKSDSDKSAAPKPAMTFKPTF